MVELRQFKDERNFLAHWLDYEGELSYSTAIEFRGRLEKIQNEAQRLRNAVHEEANKILGNFWFDDITKES